MSNNDNSINTTDLLASLEEKANAELQEREELRRELFSRNQSQNRQKNRGSKKNKQKNREEDKDTPKASEKQNTSDLEPSGSVPFDAVVGIAPREEKRKPKSDPKQSDEKRSLPASDSFDEMASRMTQEISALAEPPKEVRPEGHRSGKLSGKIAGKVGEEVTKEHAENLIKEGRKKGGARHRATIIVRTKVVDTEGKPVKEESLPEETPPAPEPEKGPEPNSEPSRPTLSLIREDTGEVYDIDGDMTIGRLPDNDICIPRPDGHYVTEHHAKIYISGKDIYLEDLDSRNGTYVNDSKIKRKKLRPGHKIEFADIVFNVIER